MSDVVIVEATRSPIGTFGGALRDVTAIQLSQFIIESIVKRSGLEKNMIDQVIMGNCFEPIDHNVARIGLVKAGLPLETTAFHIVATCGSGMQAIISGVQSIHDGNAECVISGGVGEHEHCALPAPDRAVGFPAPAPSGGRHDLEVDAGAPHRRRDGPDCRKAGRAVLDPQGGAGRLRAAEPAERGQGDQGGALQGRDLALCPCPSGKGTPRCSTRTSTRSRT